MRVAKQVAKQLKTFNFKKLENIRKTLKLGGDNLVSNNFSKNKTLAIAI